MPRSPAKSLTSTAASPPDTSLDPPHDAEELFRVRDAYGVEVAGEYIQVGSQKAARRRSFAGEECRLGGSR